METVTTVVNELIGPPPLPKFPPPRLPPPPFQVPKLSLASSSSSSSSSSSLGNIIRALIASGKVNAIFILHLILDEIVRFTNGGASVYTVNRHVLDAHIIKTPRRSDLSVVGLCSKGISPIEDEAIKRNINKCQFATRPFSSTENLRALTTTFRYIPIHDPVREYIIGILVLCVKHQHYIDAFHEKLWNDKDVDCVKDVLIETLKHASTSSPSDLTSTPPILSNISPTTSSKIEDALSKLEDVLYDGKSEYYVHYLRHLIYDSDTPQKQTLSEFTLEDIVDSFSRYTPVKLLFPHPHTIFLGDFGNLVCMMRHTLYAIGIETVSIDVDLFFNHHLKSSLGESAATPRCEPSDVVFGSSVLPKVNASIAKLNLHEKVRDVLSLPKKATLSVTIHTENVISPSEEILGLVSYTKNARVKVYPHRIIITIPIYERTHSPSIASLDILPTERQQFHVAKILNRKVVSEVLGSYDQKRLMVVCRSKRTALFLTEVYGMWGVHIHISRSLNEATKIIKYSKRKKTTTPFVRMVYVLQNAKEHKKAKSYKSIPIHYIVAKSSYLDTKKLFLKTFS